MVLGYCRHVRRRQASLGLVDFTTPDDCRTWSSKHAFSWKWDRCLPVRCLRCHNIEALPCTFWMFAGHPSSTFSDISTSLVPILQCILLFCLEPSSSTFFFLCLEPPFYCLGHCLLSLFFFFDTFLFLSLLLHYRTYNKIHFLSEIEKAQLETILCLCVCVCLAQFYKPL